MMLKTSDSLLSVYFQLAPQGWFLAAFARDKLYTPADDLTAINLLSQKLAREKRDMFRPVFHIDYISSGIVSVVWADDLTAPSEGVASYINGVLKSLQAEYDLNVVNVMEPILCQPHFLIGLNTNHFSRYDFVR